MSLMRNCRHSCSRMPEPYSKLATSQDARSAAKHARTSSRVSTTGMCCEGFARTTDPSHGRFASSTSR